MYPKLACSPRMCCLNTSGTRIYKMNLQLGIYKRSFEFVNTSLLNTVPVLPDIFKMWYNFFCDVVQFKLCVILSEKTETPEPSFIMWIIWFVAFKSI